MFKYVGDISKIAQSIIISYSASFNTAVDATLGNGYDTDFLSRNFKKVYSFDIQESAIKNYESKKKDNTVLIVDSHENFKTYINEKVDCIMYNLGFLPGSDKHITTTVESTVKSIKEGLELLNLGGLMTIAIYIGHEEGKREKDAIMNLLTNLSKKQYGVMLHSFLNRNSSAPLLAVIEKNSETLD